MVLSLKINEAIRGDYSGLPLTEKMNFDLKLVDKITTKLKMDKEVGLDNLTAKHLQFCIELSRQF